MTSHSWAVQPLEKIARLERGKFSARPRNDPRYFGGQIPFVQTGDVRSSDGWIARFSSTLNVQGVAVSKIFPKGTLLMTIAANIGDVGVTSFECAAPDSLVAVHPLRGVDKKWLYYALLARKSDLESVATNNAQLNINLEKLNPFQILVPTEAEQRAIAQDLSDADGLITGLERLLVKKRAIKQGVMQQLLTGRTRLSGFTDEWHGVHLGSVLKVRNGRSQRDVEAPGGRYPILATGGEIGRTDTPIYSKPSVLIGRKGTIDRPQFQETPFWTVDTLFYTEIGPRVNARFLYYVCTTIDWMSMNEATGVPSLTGTRIESIEVALPAREEQEAIAAVIRDADAEIEALERRLDATRAIKQGMMQELLTGRTRLVPLEAPA